MADTSIESAIEAATTAGQVRGAVLFGSDTSGAFNYARALGTRRTLPDGAPVPQQLDDILFLASATKLLAAIAALQCVEDGLLTLDGDISPLLPELANLKVLPDGASATDPLQPRTEPITLTMLLAHTSGAAYDFLVPRLSAWTAANHPLPAEGATRPVEEAFAYPLAFQPGKGWMYGPGLDWAGRAVERVTGKTLGEFIAERVYKPLGIRPEDGQFFPVKGEDVRARMVDLHPEDPLGLGLQVLNGGELNKRSKGHFGGHGLFMTGPDFVKVLRSLLVDDGKLLKKETTAVMFQDHIGAGAQAVFDAAMALPGGAFFRVGVPEDVKIGYGLTGLLTLSDTEDYYGEGTLSWGGGMTLAFFVDRKKGLCGLVALQGTLPTDVPAVTELKQVFRKDIYRKYEAWKSEAGKK